MKNNKLNIFNSLLILTKTKTLKTKKMNPNESEDFKKQREILSVNIRKEKR